MSAGLLLDCDEQVIGLLYAEYKSPKFKYDRAIGIVKDGKIIGTVIFHYWNGCNVELSYYGKNTMTAGIIKYIARFGLKHFNPARATVRTSKKNRRFIRSLRRIGFRLEGIERCYYGAEDINRNTAVRFVMFREQIEKIARINPSSEGEEKCS